MMWNLLSGPIAGIVALSVLIGGAAEAQWRWTPETGRFVNIKRQPKETAELQLEFARSFLIQGEYKNALRETGKFIDFYGDSELADQNRYLRGEIKMAEGDWVGAAQEFQQVVVNYPGSALYDQVIEQQYAIGDALYDKGVRNIEEKGPWYSFGWRPFKLKPFKKAIEVYSMVIENQPFTPAAAEAQYKVGLCHQTREEYIEAAFEYRRVIEDYSSSEWVDDASYSLAKTYEAQSLPPDYDQVPSQLTIEAIDSFAARFPGDERHAELVPVRTKMRENIARQRLNTARFYEHRRLFGPARLCYEVVVREFPETEAAKTAQAWLDANPPEDNLMNRYLAAVPGS